MGVSEIFTKKGEKILVDSDIYEILNAYSWHVSARGYARTTLKRDENGKQEQKMMHRLVLDIKDPKVLVDHRNLNKLDNRRENIRICNGTQNNANIGIHKRNKVGLKGVRFKAGKYEACIWKDKSIYLGRFDTKEEAHQAYVTEATKLFGEFARFD